MVTLVTRSGKGSPLTNTEVDTNFTNLNDGVESKIAGLGSSVNNTVPRFDGTTGKLVKSSGVTISDANVIGAAGADLSGPYSQTITAVGALDINCSSGNYFTKTINGASTFTFSNAPASRAFSFVLELTHTSGAITWPGSVKWVGGSAPTLTTGKTHLFFFVTDDAGTTWRGSALVDFTN